MIFYPGQVEVCLLQCLSNLIIVLLLCFSQWAASGALVLVTAIADGEAASMRPHLSSPDVLPGSHWPACSFFHRGAASTQSLQVFFNHYWKMNHTCHKRKALLTPFPFPELMLRF